MVLRYRIQSPLIKSTVSVDSCNACDMPILNLNLCMCMVSLQLQAMLYDPAVFKQFDIRHTRLWWLLIFYH